MDKLNIKRRDIVLGKLVAIKRDGSKIIVEVHKNSTFHKFYFWYSQIGNSRKILLRTSSRIAEIYPHYTAARVGAGLHLILFRLNGNKDIKEIFIKISKKKIYRKMIHCSPDDPILGEFPKSQREHSDQSLPIWAPKLGGVPILPYANYKTLQERMDILTGHKKR